MFTLGILVLVLGIGMIIGEFFTGSHVLIAAGTLFVIAGSVFIATSGAPLFIVNWWAVAIILFIIALVLFWLVLRIRKTYYHQVTTGQEDLKGKTVVVKESLHPEGTVMFQGELWHAISTTGNLEQGEEAVIIGFEGLRLTVAKKN